MALINERKYSNWFNSRIRSLYMAFMTKTLANPNTTILITLVSMISKIISELLLQNNGDNSTQIRWLAHKWIPEDYQMKI